MSYCGTCGTFYSPECVRRAEGGCMPAVNPYELMIVKQQTVIALAHVGVAITQCGSVTDFEALQQIAAGLQKILDQPE